jgi:mono/diheme cytochrome c family protein
MQPAVHGRAARRALPLGLAAGGWLILSASTAGADTYLPIGGAAAAAGPERIFLAQAGAAPVESPVTYASDQADRGEGKFESECEECHGGDLRGGMNGGPPLRGLAFEEKYANGAPASALFMFTSTLMPPNSPGRYSQNTYADLVAYILKRNGFRAGAPLPSDLDALDHLIMEK